MTDFYDSKALEADVLMTARALWPSQDQHGTALVDGKERDGVFVTEDNVYLIECTAEEKVDKVRKDGQKLSDLIDKMRGAHVQKVVRGYFVTLREPTAHQREALEKFKNHRDIHMMSLDQFRAKLIDPSVYLDQRDKYPFGSARNPSTGNKIDLETFVPLPMASTPANAAYTVQSLADSLVDGSSFVLLADYGSGKSMTLREVFLELRRRYFRKKIRQFPILLNLRDHHGQRRPAEAVRRHANDLGVSEEKLLRAWRAGLTILLLDGFDELTVSGWSIQAKRLQSIRRESMELVRQFLAETPMQTGVGLAGREHFFDGPGERAKALGLRPGCITLRLGVFDDSSTLTYLRNRKVKIDALPPWLPRRPLLLGYLASRGMMDASFDLSSRLAPAQGWTGLLERICEREAESCPAVDADAVRAIVSRIASFVRASSDGSGPIQPNDLTEAFTSVCGDPPDERGLLLLQRLPGLGVVESGSSLDPHNQQPADVPRAFIDDDLCSAAQGTDVFAFVRNPHSTKLGRVERWSRPISGLGLDVVRQLALDAGINDGGIAAALYHAIAQRCFALAMDLLLVLAQSNYALAKSVEIREVEIPALDVSDSLIWSRVSFGDCVFGELDLPGHLDASKIPSFSSCLFERIFGRVNRGELPAAKFSADCTVESFYGSTSTNSAIRALDLPVGLRVILTMLRKLFLQSGNGREISALARGLSPSEQNVVGDCVELLRRHDFIEVVRRGGTSIALPNRHKRERAQSIIEAPQMDGDELLVDAAKC